MPMESVQTPAKSKVNRQSLVHQAGTNDLSIMNSVRNTHVTFDKDICMTFFVIIYLRAWLIVGAESPALKRHLVIHQMHSVSLRGLEIAAAPHPHGPPQLQRKSIKCELSLCHTHKPSHTNTFTHTHPHAQKNTHIL